MPPTLLELATLSAALRQGDGLAAGSELAEANCPPLHHALDPRNPWYALNDAVMAGMTKRAQYDRDHGADARLSPYWPLLAHQAVYLRAYEDGRKVTPASLTVATVEAALEVANRLVWGGWECWVDQLQEVTGDYGEATMARPVHLVHEDGRARWFWRRSPRVAREIFSQMTGCGCLPARVGGGRAYGGSQRRASRAQRRQAARATLAPFGLPHRGRASNDSSLVPLELCRVPGDDA